MALIVGTGALALVAVARDFESLGLAAPLIGAVAVCYIGATIFLRKVARLADPLILPLAAILNVMGLAAVYRLDPDQYGRTQVIWTGVGIACFVVVLMVVRDYMLLSRFKYILGFVGVGLLMIPATPLGTEINGAQLWIKVGAFSFQPGEIAKLCLVIFLSH